MLDLMDQPDNCNILSYGDVGTRVPATEDAFGTEWEPSVKLDLVQKFIPQLLEWVEEADPYRNVPVTIADWHVNDIAGPLGAIQEQLRQVYLNNASDIITFHHYGPDVLEKLQDLQKAHNGRPVVLSSFMARDDGSTLNPILGNMYERNVWAMNWGFVNGAIQTIWNSDSWNDRYFDFPKIWHHDILWQNGTAYDSEERTYLLSFRNGKTNNTTNIDNGNSITISPMGDGRTLAPSVVPQVDPSLTLEPSVDSSHKTQPPLGEFTSKSWSEDGWPGAYVTLVGIIGLVAIVFSCAWFMVQRRRRRTPSVSFQAVGYAEELELKEFS